mgnify:FL=1
MATKRQLDALARGRAKRLKKFSLNGGINMPSTKTITDALIGTGLLVVSVLGGREIERKVFKGDEKEGLMKYMGSAIRLGGGVILATQENKFLKYIGVGLAAEGAIDATSKALGKDIFSEGILKGLEGFIDSEQISGARAYDELPPLPIEMGEGQAAIEESKNEYEDEGIS